MTVVLVFRLLIKQGARVTDKDIEGNTPLHLAAESGNRWLSFLF
jgi:ankyrin repeat protein